MARPDGGPAEIVGGNRPRSEGWWSESSKSVESFERRQRRRAHSRATAPRQIDDALQQVDEQAGERQIGPVRTGGRMNQHNPPLAAPHAGDQRRPIVEPGPRAFGDVEGWFGKDLPMELQIV